MICQPSLRIRTVFTTLLVIASFELTAAYVSAQTVEPRPVARLISSSKSVESAEYPRSRRIDTISPGAKSTPGTSAYPGLTDANSIERRAFEETNYVRTKNGLRPLVWNPELCILARKHSENMARMGFFGHETPEGMRLRDRARSAGIRGWRVLAENIAYNQGFSDPGAFAVERWMISPGHRANILDSGFEGVAIGSYVAADGRVYLTQVFITRVTL
jgi:uncharacterized protein YkwD